MELTSYYEDPLVKLKNSVTLPRLPSRTWINVACGELLKWTLVLTLLTCQLGITTAAPTAFLSGHLGQPAEPWDQQEDPSDQSEDGCRTIIRYNFVFIIFFFF